MRGASDEFTDADDLALDGRTRPVRGPDDRGSHRVIEPHGLYSLDDIAELIGRPDARPFLEFHGVKAVSRTEDLYWGGDIIDGIASGRRKHESDRYRTPEGRPAKRSTVHPTPLGQPKGHRKMREGRPLSADEDGVDYSPLV